MDRIQMAKSNMEKFFGRGAAPLEKTDPEFAAIRDRLIYGQIASRGTLGDSLRMLVTLVSLTAGQNLDGFKDFSFMCRFQKNIYNIIFSFTINYKT